MPIEHFIKLHIFLTELPLNLFPIWTLPVKFVDPSVQLFFYDRAQYTFSITLARTHSAPGHSIENNNKYSSPVIIISTSSFAEAVKPPIKESYSNSFIRIDPAAASSRGVSSLFGEPLTGIWWMTHRKNHDMFTQSDELGILRFSTPRCWQHWLNSTVPGRRHSRGASFTFWQGNCFWFQWRVILYSSRFVNKLLDEIRNVVEHFCYCWIYFYILVF